MPKILKSNEFWGKRSGNYSEDKPKGSNQPWKHHFKTKKWNNGINNSGGKKK